nr:MAG: hypothetical protein [Ezimos virus]
MSLKGKRRIAKRISSSKGVSRSELMGSKISVPENPPDINFQPWNSLVLVDSFNDKLEATTHSLTKQMWDQLDPNHHAFKDCPDDWTKSEFRLQFKIQMIRAWCLTGKMIALSVEDFMSPTKDETSVDQLCGLIDTGNSHHIPGVGYRLPLSHQQSIIRDSKEKQTGDQHLFRVVSDGPSMAYVNVLWRCDGPLKLPQFDDNLIRMVAKIKRDVNITASKTFKFEDKLGKISDQLEELIKAQPSLLSEVVGDLTVGAASVAVVGADQLVKELRELKLELGTTGFDVLNDFK